MSLVVCGRPSSCQQCTIPSIIVILSTFHQFDRRTILLPRHRPDRSRHARHGCRSRHARHACARDGCWNRGRHRDGRWNRCGGRIGCWSRSRRHCVHWNWNWNREWGWTTVQRRWQCRRSIQWMREAVPGLAVRSWPTWISRSAQRKQNPLTSNTRYRIRLGGAHRSFCFRLHCALIANLLGTREKEVAHSAQSHTSVQPMSPPARVPLARVG